MVKWSIKDGPKAHMISSGGPAVSAITAPENSDDYIDCFHGALILTELLCIVRYTQVKNHKLL